MKLHRTLLAIGLAALTAPAFAADDSVLTDAAISLWDTADTFIVMDVEGHAHVDARSAASVEQTQATLANALQGDVFGSATLRDALHEVSGNVGVNIASGVGNAQTNNVALAAISGEESNAYASAMVFSDQTSMLNRSIQGYQYGAYSASLGDGALDGATGNIGVNIAAGVGNAQGNALAASVNTAGDVAYATGDSNQASLGNQLVDMVGYYDYYYTGVQSLSARVDGGALDGAMGNIGVNVAAGVGNLQHNSLSIAANGGL